MHWMILPLKRYAEFSGRSRRMEYWMFALFSVLVTCVGYGLMLVGGGSDLFLASGDPDAVDFSFGPAFWLGLALVALWGLGALIPSIAVTVRRFHDRNMSGWYLVGFLAAIIALSLIPGIGAVLILLLELGFIVLMALPGTPGPNDYGPDPLGKVDPQTFE